MTPNTPMPTITCLFMRRFPLAAAVALASALALGCGDQSGLTAPTDPPGPSMRAGRSTVWASGSFFDESFTLAWGESFESLVASCGGPGDVNSKQFDQLNAIHGDGSVGTLIRGKDVSLVVWDHSAYDPCDLLELPHLTGTGRVSWVESDAYFSGHGAKLYTFRVTGTVTDASGQRYHVVGRDHTVLSHESTYYDYDYLHYATKIQVTPMGSR